MKKFTIFALALVFSLSLVACGGDNSEGSSSSYSNTPPKVTYKDNTSSNSEEDIEKIPGSHTSKDTDNSAVSSSEETSSASSTSTSVAKKPVDTVETKPVTTSPKATTTTKPSTVTSYPSKSESAETKPITVTPEQEMAAEAAIPAYDSTKTTVPAESDNITYEDEPSNDNPENPNNLDVYTDSEGNLRYADGTIVPDIGPIESEIEAQQEDGTVLYPDGYEIND